MLADIETTDFFNFTKIEKQERGWIKKYKVK